MTIPRVLTLRLELRGDHTEMTLHGGDRVRRPEPAVAADIVRRIRARLAACDVPSQARPGAGSPKPETDGASRDESARSPQPRHPPRSPGTGLFGDLFLGPFREEVARAIDDVRGAKGDGRLLHLVIASSAPEVATWPLELMSHPDHGLLGALPWCRVRRAPLDGWPEAGAEARERRPVGRWREPLLRRLQRRADLAQERGRHEEAVALLRSVLELERRAGRARAEGRIGLRLALALDHTEGSAATVPTAEQAAARAARGHDPETRWRAWRFLAGIHEREGRFALAGELLDRCVSLAERRDDDMARADAYVSLVRLRFATHEDLEAVTLAPRARRFCRRAGRLDWEGELDVALGRGSLRHGYPRAAVHLLANGASRLTRAGRYREAASAGTRLGHLLIRRKEDDRAAGVFIAALQTALLLDPASPGLVVEGIIRPLLADVAPHLFRRRRPDAVAAVGLLLLLICDASPRWASEPAPLPLLVGWCGRFLRLVGWIAQEGAVVEDGLSVIVADKLSRRARHLARELEILSGGTLPALRVHALAVEAAHRVVRTHGQGTTTGPAL